MLFTDERPNTDATDAASFMGMAIAHSQRGVGLTTVGVGVQFGAELATKIASVRGGNLYFVRDEPDVKALFAEQLDTMVSELAHDLTVTITPRAGLRIAGVYGVPGQMLGWQNGTTVSFTIPTVFLDHRGGGVFFTLAPDAADGFLPEKTDASPLADVSVNYQGRDRVAGADSLSISLNPEPSAGMRLGHLLIDEYTVLHGATHAHHVTIDQEVAFQLLTSFKQRIDASPLEGLADERKLISALQARIAFLSGHGAEAAGAPSFVKLWGRWKIVGLQGPDVDLRSGELLEFTPDNDMRTYSKKDRAAPRDQETYQLNDRQIYLSESDLVFWYQVKGDRMSLHHRASGLWVRLVRDGG
jgi:Ca-activated chloride channel family protein